MAKLYTNVKWHVLLTHSVRIIFSLLMSMTLSVPWYNIDNSKAAREIKRDMILETG